MLIGPVSIVFISWLFFWNLIGVSFYNCIDDQSRLGFTRYSTYHTGEQATAIKIIRKRIICNFVEEKYFYTLE